MIDDLKIIKNIASRIFNEKGIKIYLFGSRARDDFYPSSDIDIAVEGANRISIISFKEELEESKIPYKIDVIDLKEAPENLKKMIKIEGKIIWKN